MPPKSLVFMLGYFLIGCNDDYDVKAQTSDDTELVGFASSNTPRSEDFSNNFNMPKSPKAHRIIGGTTTPVNQFSYIVSLRHDGSHKCGGSLLADFQTVITVAHCVYEHGFVKDADSLSVAVGFRHLSDARSSNIIRVDHVIVHPDYDEDTLENDIALVRLQRSAASMPNVATVRLPPANATPPIGQKLQTAGWGLTRSGTTSGAPSRSLRTVNHVARATCRRALSRRIPSSQICTDNVMSGTCYGDSGGPLVNRRLDGDYLVGITSHGVDRSAIMPVGSRAWLTAGAGRPVPVHRTIYPAMLYQNREDGTRKTAEKPCFWAGYWLRQQFYKSFCVRAGRPALLSSYSLFLGISPPHIAALF
ncbi:trypsin beta-like isoform X2 [Paramacrobiotus metropolitanus]|uniref:trypsin beta-like isoform X2 n=1 Tax=Paramacrobiotus metropolitanus TaxID=2943436 RepID=UPI002445BB8C|nr:trypsin beta-like isoform X2 [Paramacrobiotus metropolitanus]